MFRIEGERSSQEVLTDLILLFFVFFIVLYPLSVIGTEAITGLTRELTSLFRLERLLATAEAGGQHALDDPFTLPEAERALKRLLYHSPLAGSVIVGETQEGLVISLLTERFFHPDAMSMRPEALVMLERVAPILERTPNPIRIEGHTAATERMGEVFSSTWELSAGRAVAVLRTLLAHGLPPSRLSIVSYAANRPVASNSTPEGRMRNRRVDIVLIAGDLQP